LKSCIGSGTFELRYGTATKSRSAADTMEKIQGARALQ
jgi:hypothetical protein